MERSLLITSMVIMSPNRTSDPIESSSAFLAGAQEKPCWVVVASCAKRSHLSQRREMYQAVLQLEREGAAVVDRDLRCEDLALSASTCLCIWTEKSFQASFNPSLFWFAFARYGSPPVVANT